MQKEMKKNGKKLNIVNYVVFANSRINVTNRYKYFRTCFLSQLPHLIDDYVGQDIYTIEDLERMKDIIHSAEDKKAYPLGFDIGQMKEDFAMTMAILEVQVFDKNIIVDSTDKVYTDYCAEGVEKCLINQGAMKYIGAVAAFVLTLATTVTIRKHTK